MQPEKMDRRVRKTRKQLREGLARLLEKKSIRDIKVKELVEEVDINRSTFYLHYSDIYDMLEKIEDELFREIKDAIEAHPFGDTMHDEAFIREMFEIMAENRAICKALIGPNGDMSFVSKMEEVIGEQAVKAAEPLYRDAEKNELMYLYAYCLNGCVGLVKMWLLKDGEETPSEMADFMFRMVKNSLQERLAEKAMMKK